MKKIKVLVVEDEIDIRDTVAEILMDEGFEVVQAEDGKDGYHAFKKHDPDIVVSDVMMPEIDGYGLLDLIRKTKTKNNLVPFIFLTALGQKENIIKGAELSANDYLVKPIDFEILIAKIREKTSNAVQVKANHDYGINNIKSQISSALPNELNHNIDSMMMYCENLINEPYGPFPHRKYKEDLLKINQSLKRLKTSVNNFLDEDVINKKLDPNEEVMSLEKFFKSSIEKLPENISSKIKYYEPFDVGNFPNIKINKFNFVSIFKSIIAATIKSGNDCTLEISTILDNHDRVVIIFYIIGGFSVEKFSSYLQAQNLEDMATSQGCQFDVNFDDAKGNNITLIVPNYRILK